MYARAMYELMYFYVEFKYRTLRVYQGEVLVYNKRKHTWVDISITKERFYKLMKKYDIRKFSEEVFIND